MGYLFTHGQTRAELIAKLTRSYINRESGTQWTCLKHCIRGNVLWTVREGKNFAGGTRRFIGCDILAKEKDWGWGYKDMSEQVHPYYYSCPLAYLEMVPEVKCKEWRRLVREYHANTQKPKIGEELRLQHATIPHVVVTSVRPLRGTYGGQLYRIPRRLIA